MDEKKILILCAGDGLPAGGFMDRFVKQLVSEGMATVEICNVDNIKMGTEAKILAWDEMTNVDFTEMEHRAQAMMLGEKIHQTVEGVASGRISKDSPEFQELPGVDELHSDAWNQLLKLGGADRELTKQATFLDRYSAYGRCSIATMDNLPMPQRGSGKALLNQAYRQFVCRPKPADHPTRKREPKGPRGKWGKIK